MSRVISGIPPLSPRPSSPAPSGPGLGAPGELRQREQAVWAPRQGEGRRGSISTSKAQTQCPCEWAFRTQATAGGGLRGPMEHYCPKQRESESCRSRPPVSLGALTSRASLRF